MISESEQRRLAEIEMVLRRDDPAFGHRGDRHRQHRCPIRSVATPSTAMKEGEIRGGPRATGPQN